MDQARACGDGDAHLLKNSCDLRSYKILVNGQDEVGQAIDGGCYHLVVVRIAADTWRLRRFYQLDVVQQVALECPQELRIDQRGDLWYAGTWRYSSISSGDTTTVKRADSHAITNVASSGGRSSAATNWFVSRTTRIGG